MKHQRAIQMRAIQCGKRTPAAKQRTRELKQARQAKRAIRGMDR